MKTIVPLLLILAPPAHAADPLDLGSRWELFVDEHLVAEKHGVALKLQEPVKREIVLTTDQPWACIGVSSFHRTASNRLSQIANIGARTGALGDTPACVWNHRSAPSSHAGSRSRKFSWLTRCERVSNE